MMHRHAHSRPCLYAALETFAHRRLCHPLRHHFVVSHCHAFLTGCHFSPAADLLPWGPQHPRKGADFPPASRSGCLTMAGLAAGPGWAAAAKPHAALRWWGPGGAETATPASPAASCASAAERGGRERGKQLSEVVWWFPRCQTPAMH